MWCVWLTGFALAADPPASDLPSERTYDWPAVHDRAISTAHASQAAGAAAATAMTVGLVLTYAETDFNGVGAPNPRATGAAIGIGAGGLVVTSAILNASALRAREASSRLGSRKSPGPGIAGWAFTGASAAAWIGTGVLLERDGKMPGPALPAAAAITGVGGWVAGTIQLALDKQASGEINGGVPVQEYRLELWFTPGGIAGRF